MTDISESMINDGGPAFPDSGGQANYTGGMTLRDYFAAKALVALIAEPVIEAWPSTLAHWATQVQGHAQMSGPDIVAHVAYMMADAMLKAREASNDHV